MKAGSLINAGLEQALRLGSSIRTRSIVLG
jgi:hypothetical protein